MKSGPQEVSDVQSSAAGWLVEFDMMRLSVIQTGRTRGLRFPGKLSNFDTYDPNANYSSVLFQQYLASPQTKKTLPGMYGDRMLNLYGGPDCRDLDPEEDVFRDWYGFSCWSEPEGTCGTLPYKLVSFSVQPGIVESQQDGTCWTFAHRGAAAEGIGHSQMAVRVLVGAAIALWIAL